MATSDHTSEDLQALARGLRDAAHHDEYDDWTHVLRPAAAALERLADTTPQWRDIDTAPRGLTPSGRFQRVLFRGVSTGRSFDHPAVVDGWVGSDGKPVHCYSYRLRITHWMPLPEEPR